MAQPLLLADVAGLLDDWYPAAWADSWDAVGTVCGDPAAPVRRILLAVDPVQDVVDEAVGWDADLLVTHHPLLLKPVHSVAATTPKGRVVHALVRNGIGLHVCHTNADSPPGGVSEALATAVGVIDPVPLDPDPADPMDKIVAFVPHDAVERVVDALAAAGRRCAGRLRALHVRLNRAPEPSGRCRVPDPRSAGWVTSSTFPSHGSGDGPAAGTVARPWWRRCAASHPYEEPAFDVLELADAAGTAWQRPHRPARRAGRRWARSPRSVAAALPSTAAASCGWPAIPRRRVETVAVCGGAGDFMLDRARGQRRRRLRDL